MSMRRLVKVAVSNIIIIDLFKKGWNPCEDGFIICTTGIQEDAVFMNAYTEPGKRTVYFVFEHDSFPEVAPGEEIPEYQVSYTRFKGKGML